VFLESPFCSLVTRFCKCPLFYLTLTHGQAILSLVSDVAKKVDPRKNSRRRILLGVLILFYIGAFFWLYHRYIPQIQEVQLLLIPILGFCLILTSISLKKGTFVFIFCIPLLNSLPNFLGLKGFNPLFVLFYAYFLGVLLHRLIHPYSMRWTNALSLPIISAAVLIGLSAVVTLWRYANFFPLHCSAVYDWVVNVLNVSAGEAIRLVIFESLNYLAGFLWFFCVISVLRTKDLIRKSVIVLAVSTSLSFAFGLFQAFVDTEMGNTDFWLAKGQINALFTDPNALGVYMSLVFPLFAGAYLTFKRKNLKALFLLVLSMGIILLPQSGSRSGLLGLVLAAFVFLFFVLRSMTRDPARKARIIWESLILLVIFAGVLTLAAMTGKDSILFRRIFPSQDVSVKGEPGLDILNARQILWPAGFHMVSEFPLSGVGVGSFTCELPNYYIQYGIAPVMTSAVNRKVPTKPVLIDTSGNFYLQIASEMGLVALVIFLWIFVLILRRGWEEWLRKRDGDRTMLRAGMTAGLTALLVIFVFGVHTLSFEIQMIFWLLIGCLFADDEERERRRHLSKAAKILVWIGIALFAVSHLVNSMGDLSLPARTQKFRLVQGFGFHPKEISQGRKFMWSKNMAAMTIKVEKPVMELPVHASHPDIAEHPVGLKIYTIQNMCKDKVLVADVVIKNNLWQTIRLEMPGKTGQELLLLIQVSRTWQPLKVLGTPDPRHLGIAVAEVSFDRDHPRLQTYPPERKINLIDKLTQGEWRGPQGPKLYKSGRCWIDVSLSEGGHVFKLWARGDLAEDVWPYLVLWLDDEMIGERWVSSHEWRPYEFSKKVEEGKHRISVVFANDFYLIKPDSDRNLFVGDLEIYRQESD